MVVVMNLTQEDRAGWLYITATLININKNSLFMFPKISRQYYLFSRFGEYLVFKKGGAAVCESKRYCKRFDNWHWWEPHQRCYRQFSQGPCKKGEI